MACDFAVAQDGFLRTQTHAYHLGWFVWRFSAVSGLGSLIHSLFTFARPNLTCPPRRTNGIRCRTHPELATPATNSAFEPAPNPGQRASLADVERSP